MFYKFWLEEVAFSTDCQVLLFELLEGLCSWTAPTQLSGCCTCASQLAHLPLPHCFCSATNSKCGSTSPACGCPPRLPSDHRESGFKGLHQQWSWFSELPSPNIWVETPLSQLAFKTEIVSLNTKQLSTKKEKGHWNKLHKIYPSHETEQVIWYLLKVTLHFKFGDLLKE